MASILTGHSAIVTGAGRGFGRAIAERLALEGAAVTVTSRTKSELDDVVESIRKAGGRAFAISSDVTQAKDVERVVLAAHEQFGPVSLLVSNAGVPGPFGPVSEIDPEVWWAAQAVHVKAPLLYLRNVLPEMMARGAGRVILVSALASRLPTPYMSAYCTGKISQNRLMAEAALEVKDRGVSLFSIDPGFVFTSLAESTLNSPDAQAWMPGMVERLKAKKDEPNRERDFERCAQRCLDLASGRYDALSGRYLELSDDLDGMVSDLQAGKKPTGVGGAL
jgi:NAD(P)-dependent dehydrogenase (short-subunit alcohol dehydrogenase family)